MLKRLHLGLGLTVVAAALSGACTVNVGITGMGGGGGGQSSGTGNNGASGLPCDVAAVINAKCASCHSNPPTAGAPTALLSAADLQAPAKTNPSVTMAQQSVTRMKAAVAPMPPQGGSTDAEIAAFQTWIDAGYPTGDCGGTGMPDPAFSGPSVCTSNRLWATNNYDSHEQMQPGLACNSCHNKSGDAPIYSAAGTVYPTGHEPNLCYGISGSVMTDVIVRITDKNGVNHDLKPGPTGNFTYKGSLALPYTAMVISSKGQRIMSSPQTNGDCNLCHTDAAGGNGSTAAGRIVIPF